MKRNRGALRRIAVGTALAAVVSIGIGAASGSAATTTMQCTGSGTVNIANGSGGSGFGWTVDLSGASCSTSQQQLGGTVTGTGTSDTLGLCPTPPQNGGSLTVSNLNINVTEKLSGALGNTTINDTWGASQTNFPETTPFQITRNGQIVGSGSISTHIYAHCPPSGSPSAQVTWTEQL